MSQAIVAGDPRAGAASFIRFVFPFGYACAKRPARAADQHALSYEPADANDWLHATGDEILWLDDATNLDAARWQYMTYETANVLFKRTGWFVLREKRQTTAASPAPGLMEANRSSETRPSVWRQFDLPSPGGRRKYRVALRHPALVLFEWDGGRPPTDKGGSDILQSGLLVIEAFFPGTEESNKSGDTSETPTCEDFLRFQEIFRYCHRPYQDHEGIDERGAYKNPELPIFAEIFLGALGSDILPREECRTCRPGAGPDFHYGCRWSHLLRLPLLCTPNPKKSKNTSLVFLEPPHTGWPVNADNRAFVQSCLLLPSAVERSPTAAAIDMLVEWGKTGDTPGEKAPGFGLWIKQLNVDGPSTDPPDSMEGGSAYEREWAAERTYRRWLHRGTAYGFSTHSMAMLSEPSGNPPTWLHFGQMYFDQLALMLYVRVSLFRFSRQLSVISERARGEERRWLGNMWKVRERFRRLRRTFDWFTNLYQFPLLSTQQQAVEMYAYLRKELDIEVIYKEVENEVDGTHEVLELESASELNRLAMVIGFVGIMGAAFGVMQTILAYPSVAKEATGGKETRWPADGIFHHWFDFHRWVGFHHWFEHEHFPWWLLAPSAGVLFLAISIVFLFFAGPVLSLISKVRSFFTKLNSLLSRPEDRS